MKKQQDNRTLMADSDADELEFIPAQSPLMKRPRQQRYEQDDALDWEHEDNEEVPDFTKSKPMMQKAQQQRLKDSNLDWELEEEEESFERRGGSLARSAQALSVKRTAQPGRKGHSADPEYADEEQFEAGVRALQDVLAPTSIEVQKDHICVDGRYIRYFSVVALPRRLTAGWVEQLTRMKIPMQICFHFSPFDAGMIVRKLEMRLTALESKRLLDSKQGRIEKMQDNVGSDDIRRILLSLEQGTVRIFSVSLTIGVHASTLERLNQRAQFLLTHLNQYRLTTRDATFLQDSAWRTATPGSDLLNQRTNLDSGSLAMCLPFTSSTIGTGDGAFLGFAKTGEPMFFNPWSKKRKLPNGSIVVCGESGQGKSYLTKKLALGLMTTGNVDCVVIDRDGDYDPLCEWLGENESQYIKLAQGCPINPFDLPFTPQDILEGEGQDFLSEHIDNSLLTFLSMLLTDVSLSKHEEAVLYQTLVKAYTKAGLTNEEILRDPNTLYRPAPLFSDLITILGATRQTDAISLAERLEKSSYLFKNHTDVSLDKPLTVFSIKGLDDSQYPLMIYTVKNFVNRNRAQLRYERFLLFLIEEASFMLRHPRGRKYLEESSRGVRKFGIAQATISQHPNDFLRDGEVIVANAGTCFFLGMDSSAIEKLKLTPELERVLAQAKPGECVCRIGNEYSHFRVVASPEEHKLFTTDPGEQMQARAQKKVKTTTRI
jgi:hypothetical protein